MLGDTKVIFKLFEVTFGICTTCTPLLMLGLMGVELGNRHLTNRVINCTVFGVEEKYDAKLNNFCWNQRTFLVAKALQPQMRSSVKYPGVYDYNRETDELIEQNYYNKAWMVFVPIIVMSFLLDIAWKNIIKAKIKPFVAICDLECCSTEDFQVKYYLKTVGCNNRFARSYVSYKILAIMIILIQCLVSGIFVGKRFKSYGVDVIIYFLGDANAWPNPMDALFPKIAKCESSIFNLMNNLEVLSSQCQLLLNHVNQWAFLLYWYWLVTIFLLMLPICFYSLVNWYTFRQPYRLSQCFGAERHEENDLEYKLLENEDIYINYGDWLVLNFKRIYGEMEMT